MAEQKRADKDRKIMSYIFDKITIDALGKLMDKRCIKDLDGIIKSGKESRILLGKDKRDNVIIIKIYMIETSSFTKMMNYIRGDKRFSKVGKSKRKIVNTWCRKEMRNLEKARSAGLSVPEPICSLENVLVMEIIEENGSIAPQLSETEVKDPALFFEDVKEMMRKLYKETNLVHADLSQYNILVRDDKPVFIDMGQSVLKDHPKAGEFLRRDVKNIVKYFTSLGVKADEMEVLEFIKR